MKTQQLHLALDGDYQSLSPAEGVPPLLRYETSLWKRGRTRVAGVDEVGIGPLAGPVVSAAVVFPPGTYVSGVTDSKLLSATAREHLGSEIRKMAAGIGIGIATVEEIDELNIYHAALLAMRRAVEALPDRPQYLLVDARRIRGTGIPQTSLIKGDRSSLSIASASIIAKIYRDTLMIDLAHLYPDYGFAQHKGYPTQSHQQAIRHLGPSAVHRRSFPFISELTGGLSSLFYALRSSISSSTDEARLLEARSRYELSRANLTASERRKLTLLLRRQRTKLKNRPGILGKSE